MQKFIIILFFLLINPSSVVCEKNTYFLSLKKDKVYVRYGPGKDYPIKYIYRKKFLPIKVIDKKDNFKTIIDHKESLDNLKIVIAGDLDHSRVTSSFVEGISNFDVGSLTF